MVEIRGKLADANDDKAAHSLSTKKNVDFCAISGIRKQSGQTSAGSDLRRAGLH